MAGYYNRATVLAIGEQRRQERYRADTSLQVSRQKAMALASDSGRRAAPTGPSVSPEARTAIQTAMAQYKEGGGFGQGVEAGLQRGRTQAMSSGMQNLVSSGLAGTTIAGGLGKKYEEEVAAPTRANVASVRAERTSALQAMLAQMEQGGFQAGLNRQFAASESAANRSLQMSMGGTSQGGGIRGGGGQPMSVNPLALEEQRFQNAMKLAEFNQPRGPGPGIYAKSSTRRYAGAPGVPSTLMESAEQAYSPPPKTPGSYIGSVNGQRYIYSETGFPARA